jgi:hypothetical protein
MPFCLVIGDSIAVGVADELRMQGVPCQVEAKVGMSTAGWRSRYGGWQGISPADAVIISLGSNDRGAAYHDLWQVRKSTQAKHVIWILPANNPAADHAIQTFARELGDTVIAFAPGHDGVHPHSYRELVKHLVPALDRR